MDTQEFLQKEMDEINLKMQLDRKINQKLIKPLWFEFQSSNYTVQDFRNFKRKYGKTKDKKEKKNLKELMDLCIRSSLDVRSIGQRLSECGNTYDIFRCEGCNKVHLRTHSCFERYCKVCYNVRFNRNYARLMDYFKNIRKLFHLCIGFKRKNLYEFERKETLKIMGKFRQIVRKFGVKFSGLRCFDLGRFDNENDTNYIHYHYAMLIENIFNQKNIYVLRKVKNVNRILKKKNNEIRKLGFGFSEINVNFYDENHVGFYFKNSAYFFDYCIRLASKNKIKKVELFGYRKIKGLMGYFAVRMSGLYGKPSERYFLSDIMDIEKYAKIFYNIKSLVGVGDVRSPDRDKFQYTPCPFCKSSEVSYLGYGFLEDLVVSSNNSIFFGSNEFFIDKGGGNFEKLYRI